MFNCRITKPLGSEVCDTQIAGVQRIAILNYADFVGVDADCGALKIYTKADGAGTDATKFLDVVLTDNTGYANATLSTGGNNTKAINHQVGGAVTQIDCNLLSDWKNYILSTVVIAVQTKNGDVMLYGASNGLTATNFDSATGTAATDASGLTFLFEGLQKEAPISIGTADMSIQEKWEIVLNPEVKP